MKCLVCKTETVTQVVTYSQEYNGQLVAVENVPADVCPRCGEQYFAPETVDKIQKVIYSGDTAKKLEIPVFDYSKKVKTV
jgi:HTH-type transcriptional regulator / antitoxin MqsA